MPSENLQRALPWIQPLAVGRTTRHQVGGEGGLDEITSQLIVQFGCESGELVRLERVNGETLCLIATIGLTLAIPRVGGSGSSTRTSQWLHKPNEGDPMTQQPINSTPELTVDFGEAGRHAWIELAAGYRSTLALPPDDMWSTFADHADAAAMMLEDKLIGNAAVDADGALHRFYVQPSFEHLGEQAFAELRRIRPIRTMLMSTADPGALSVLLPYGRDATPVALLYTLDGEPAGDRIGSVRAATEADHEHATDVVAESTGGPVDFVGPYLAERIDRRELMIHEQAGEIVATGERRVDRQSVGHAQLGIVVHRDFRGRGLGGKMMNSLVAMCRDEQLTPLCSTEPGNRAAQQVIRRAGFRSRHTIFRTWLRSDADQLDSPAIDI